MIEHLLLSTIVLGLAIVAARLLPLTARTRYALLLAGLAKFAIPSSAIAALLRVLGLAPVPTPIALPFRVFNAGTAPGTATPSVDWVMYAWIAVAIAIFASWLILRTRTIAAALRTGSAPSARELDALAFARRTLPITAPVDLLRSPICEAPAVIRVLRPTILLPSHACDALDDDELRTLILHECAHIIRHDNLVSTLEMLAGALLWFHPLVWLALRDLAAAREEACDELVAETASSTDAYLSALSKICRAVLVSRTAGASCMASAHLTERIEHLMNYARLKQKAFSHRSVLAVTVLAILAVTTGATALSFERAEKLRQIYKLSFSVTPAGDNVAFKVDVIDQASGRVVASPNLNFRAGQWGTSDVKDGVRDITLRARGQKDGSAELLIDVKEDGERVQLNLYTFTPKPDKAVTKEQSKFIGEPISLSLKDADLKDVLRTFSALTGYDIAAPGVESGKVTIDVKDMPWDEALVKIATDHGLDVKIEGKKITLHR